MFRRPSSRSYDSTTHDSAPVSCHVERSWRPMIAALPPGIDPTLRRSLSVGGGINVDGHPAYASAIPELKQSGELSRRCRCRTSPYLNNLIAQDHRFIKKRIAASLGFRSAARGMENDRRLRSDAC